MVKSLANLYERTRWRAFPEAIDCLQRVKALGLKTALITTIASFRYEKDLMHLIDRIDLPVDGFTFHCEKFNPRIYLDALGKLHLKPGEVVMIGDDMELDVVESSGLGMKAILLDRTGKLSTKDCKQAQAVVSDLTEAIDYLSNR